jgi:hypothetical protein
MRTTIKTPREVARGVIFEGRFVLHADPFFVLFVTFVVKQSSMKSGLKTGASIPTRHAPDALTTGVRYCEHLRTVKDRGPS